MMKGVITLVLTCLFTGITVFSQQKRTCDADVIMKEKFAKNPNAEKIMHQMEAYTQKRVKELKNLQGKIEGEIYKIPVVIHVLYTESSNNISTAQIQSQLDVMNADFRRTNSDRTNKWSQAADTKIEFYLAKVDPNGNTTTGITRTQVSKSTWNLSLGEADQIKKSAEGGVDPWDTSEYLNMWIVDKLIRIRSDGSTSNILGFAQFPWDTDKSTDGVVMADQYFGTIGTAQAPYDKGRTTTHELGHFFGLRHIWGDGSCGEDDFVSDTPESDAANYGCATGHVSCGSEDMTENFMDYSDDSCMNLFTEGQRDRIHTYLASGGARRALALSDKSSSAISSCVPAVPTGVEVSNIMSTKATINWNSAPGVDYEVRFKKQSETVWKTINVELASVVLNELASSTSYEIQVRSKCGSSNSEYSTLKVFTTEEFKLTYCNSLGSNATDESIGKVQIGSINNTSVGTPSGYTDYTSISTDLVKGSTVTITITPNWSGAPFDEGYAVFIDYNNDGDFSDNGETVWTKLPSQLTPVTGSFVVPTTAKAGSTRMRVILRYDNVPSSCGAFGYGETEDYTVNLKEKGVPVVSTSPASSLGIGSAMLGGDITSDGGATIEERGIVYSKTSENSDPLIGGTNVIKDTNGVGIGVFSKTISGLVAGTKYSFKAYAINAIGTSYGDVSTFTTTGKVWTGATDTDWSTASNWNPNVVPIATDDIVIPNVVNKPIIGSNIGVVINNLNIDENSSVTIESGGSLLVNGTANVNGNLIYKVNIKDTKWHLISSPVAGEQYDDSWNTNNNVAVNLPNEAVAKYINTTGSKGSWEYFQDGSDAKPFESGIAYAMKRTNEGFFTFVGKFPSSSINTNITAVNLGAQNENRWTLVGNPFPAYINISTFLSTNTTPLTDTHESIYIWNANTNNYEALASGYIQPGQGFFVNSNEALASIAFTKEMQSHQNEVSFYRSNSDPLISVIAKKGNQERSTEIRYIEGKTTGLDPRFDIGTFTGNSSDFNIYTRLVGNDNGVDFVKQALPDTDYEYMVVPIGVKAKKGEEVIFSIKATHLPDQIKVYLEDKENHSFIRLDEDNSSYKTTVTSDISEKGRFYIHTSKNNLSEKDVILETIKIFKTNNSTIRVVGLQNINKAELNVYTVLGREVFKTSVEKNRIQDVTIPRLTTGVYIVNLDTDKGKLTRKIVIE